MNKYTCPVFTENEYLHYCYLYNSYKINITDLVEYALEQEEDLDFIIRYPLGLLQFYIIEKLLVDKYLSNIPNFKLTIAADDIFAIVDSGNNDEYCLKEILEENETLDQFPINCKNQFISYIKEVRKVIKIPIEDRVTSEDHNKSKKRESRTVRFL